MQFHARFNGERKSGIPTLHLLPSKCSQVHFKDIGCVFHQIERNFSIISPEMRNMITWYRVEITKKSIEYRQKCRHPKNMRNMENVGRNWNMPKTTRKIPKANKFPLEHNISQICRKKINRKCCKKICWEYSAFSAILTMYRVEPFFGWHRKIYSKAECINLKSITKFMYVLSLA